MPPIILPLEIEETILDLLAEDDKRHSALKTCSLVCKTFLPICRKHIFERISLNNAKLSPTTLAFHRLLCGTPEIADYIRVLRYDIQYEDLTIPSIQKSLKQISRLESLWISNNSSLTPRLDWSNNPIRPALLHLLHLPTLTHLTMSIIDDFVISDLIACVNLKYLQIAHHMSVAAKNTFPVALPKNSIQLNEFEAGIRSNTVIMKLCTARRPDGQPVIDFGSVSKITAVTGQPEYGEPETSQMLFSCCHGLTDVNITFGDPQNVMPSLANMLRPSMQTLKHIALTIEVDGDGVDPLFGIPSELEDMRTKNIIETITIQVLVDEKCRRGDDWGRLDKVLTAPGWFSLKEVSLVIEIAIHFKRDRDDDDDELEEALRELPETQFPRLSSSNSVSFDFEVNPTFSM